MSSINRKCHSLKREKTLAMPRHLIFFDTETMQEVLPDGSIKQKLKLGWACYYQRAYGRNLNGMIGITLIRHYHFGNLFISIPSENASCGYLHEILSLTLRLLTGGSILGKGDSS